MNPGYELETVDAGFLPNGMNRLIPVIPALIGTVKKDAPTKIAPRINKVTDGPAIPAVI